MSDLWVGTTGYSYDEWNGTFYPEGLPERDRLRFYGERFASVEINQTFYRTPNLRTFQSWAKDTPSRFTFSLKAPRRITHDQQLRDAGEAVPDFFDAVEALGGKLGTVLFQLPPFLRKDVPRLEDFLHQLPPGYRAAIEFRSPSWYHDDVFACLQRFGVALCISDRDEKETPFETTAAFGYLRLRRSEYSEADLATWAERLAGTSAAWSSAYVYFKHEQAGRGPALATRFAELTAQVRGEAAAVAG